MIHVDFMMSGHKQRFILRLEANNQAISTLSKLYHDTVTLWLPGIRKLITYYTWHCAFLGYENRLVRTRCAWWVMIPSILSKSLYVPKRVFALVLDPVPRHAMDTFFFQTLSADNISAICKTSSIRRPREPIKSYYIYL